MNVYDPAIENREILGVRVDATSVTVRLGENEYVLDLEVAR